MQESILKLKHCIQFYCTGQVIANIAMVITVIFWGISFVSIKIAVAEIPPITMALIRFIIAAVILGVILRKMEPDTKMEKKDFPKMLAGGILGITFYFYFENTGVMLTTAANASLIVMIVPVLTIVLDMVFFHSKMSLLKLTGIMIAIAGSYLSVTGNGQLELDAASFKGNMLILCSMLAWALYTLVNKSLQGKYSGLFLTTWQTILGTLCLIPLSLTEYHEWQWFSLLAFWNVLFLALFCSVLCYLLYVYALKRLDVAATTLYLNLVPVVGVVSGYFILHESVLLIQLVGGLVTVIAIILVNMEKNSADQ
jgi:drug/metabolite transporter (DMT)-like permease